MDIKTMIEGHREVIDTVRASLKESGFDSALLRRPVELHEQRAAGVRARIGALEAARSEYVAKVDADIKLLKSELSTIEARIKTERENLEAVTKGKSPKPTGDRKPTTPPRAASPERLPKKATTRVAAKSSKKPMRGGEPKGSRSKKGRGG